MNVLYSIIREDRDDSDSPSTVSWPDLGSFESDARRIAPECKTPEELARQLGLSVEKFEHFVGNAVSDWKESPSRSAFAAVNWGGGPGSPLFKNLLWQTRFLTVSSSYGFFSKARDLRPVRAQDGEFAVVKGSPAATLAEWSGDKLENVLKYCVTYFAWNAAYAVKAPKWVYRGIRIADISVRESYESYMESRRERVERFLDALETRGLAEVSHTSVLSFTASASVAKYFSDGGLVVKLDPKRATVLTSHDHDMRLSGADEVSGRDEKEYVLKIAPGTKIARSDVTVMDPDYHLSVNSPLAVPLLDHDDKRAEYEIDGTAVRAAFFWNSSGTSGSVRYAMSGDWYYYSRREFKQSYGFDPTPTEKNLDRITNFRWERTR